MKTQPFPYYSTHGRTHLLPALVFILLGVGRLLAQPASEPLSYFWQTDGIVNALVVTNSTAYLGGDFSYVGPRSGGAGLVDATTGAAQPGFSKLDGTINAVIPDGEGGWYLGGRFTSADNASLKNLVHLLPDRRLDSSFKPSPNAAVSALALVGPTLWVGGDFTEIAGIPTGNLGLLDSSTGQTNGLRLRVQGAVNAIVPNGDVVYLGGAFGSIVTYRGNQSTSNARGRAAALRPTGDLLDWNPACTGGSGVNCIAVSDSTIYLGGDFTQCGGKPRNALASVSATDALATSWNPNPQRAGGARPTIQALVVIDDVVYAGGEFTTIGARSRGRLAAVQGSGLGQALPDWQADANGPVQAILAWESDLLIAGGFTLIGGEIDLTKNPPRQTGGTARRGFARLSQANALVSNWGPQLSLLKPATQGSVVAYGAAVQGNLILLGGNFVSLGGATRPHIAALSLLTGAATDWNPAADSTVRTLALGRQGLYVGGSFTNIGGAPRPRLAEIDLATGQATTWDPQFGAGQFVAAIAPAGTSVFVGGTFQNVGGRARQNLAEIDFTGSVTEWDPKPNGAIGALLFDRDQLFVGGNFSVISGASRVNLALLTTNAVTAKQLVKTFDAKLVGLVRTLALSANGPSLYVGGDFSRAGGQDRKAVASLDPATGLELAPWDAQISGTGPLQVRAVLPLGQAVYIGGQFRAAGGENRSRAGSVHPEFGVASGWDPGVDAPINAISRSSEILLIGGEFTRLGLHGATPNANTDGQPMTYVAAFSALPQIESIAKTAANRWRLAIADGDGLGTSLLLQSTPSLTNPEWKTLETLEILGQQEPIEDTETAGSPTQFYRLVRQP